MLWQIGLLICAAFCFLYYAVICISLRKWDSTFARFWPAAGAAFVACALLLRVTELDPVIYILLALAAGIFLYTEGKILSCMNSRKEADCAWLIVLGAHVEGDRVTDSLKRRLDRAFRYLESHPYARAVLSGGQGEGEAVSEAEAMAGYLKAKGIDPKRLILEDRSTTTEENLRFSKALIGSVEEPVGIVSNNFHLYRACLLAERLGYRKACPMAAGCHPVLLINYMVREFFAVWKAWIKKRC